MPPRDATCFGSSEPILRIHGYRNLDQSPRVALGRIPVAFGIDWLRVPGQLGGRRGRGNGRLAKQGVRDSMDHGQTTRKRCWAWLSACCTMACGGHCMAADVAAAPGVGGGGGEGAEERQGDCSGSRFAVDHGCLAQGKMVGLASLDPPYGAVAAEFADGTCLFQITQPATFRNPLLMIW
jgi:hypothetical protein